MAEYHFFYMDDVLLEGDNGSIQGRAVFEITEDERDTSHPDEACGKFKKTARAEFLRMIIDGTTFDRSMLTFVLTSQIEEYEDSAAEKWLEEN